MGGWEGTERADLAESYGLPDFAPDYWKEAIGGTWRCLTGLGKHRGSHPVTVRRVLENAKTACPEAADVIVALVHDASVASEGWRALSEQVKELQAQQSEIEDENALMRRLIDGLAAGYREALAQGFEGMLGGEGDHVSLAALVGRHLVPSLRDAAALAERDFRDAAEG